MKVLALLGALLFGSWFWQRPAIPRDAAWPAAMPVFAGGRPDCAYTLANGTAFASLRLSILPAAALEQARAAYEAAGWCVAPVRARDTLIFVRGESVAAVLAEPVPSGTRVTALQRPRGL